MDVVQDETLDHDRVRERHGRRLDDGREARREQRDHERRHRQLPLRGPGGAHGLLNRERVPRRTLSPAHADAVHSHDHDQEQSRHEARQIERVDRHVGDDGVEDDREARRQQQPEAARGRHEAERESLRVLLLAQDRVEQSAEGHDRHTRSARERCEQRAHGRHQDRDAPRHPAEQRAEEADEPGRRVRFGQHVAARCQERDRGERRRDHEPVDLGRHGGHRHGILEEQHQGDAPHGDEHRGPDEGGEQDEREEWKENRVSRGRNESDPERDPDGRERRRPPHPSVGGAPREPDRDERERERHDALAHPHR